PERLLQAGLAETGVAQWTVPVEARALAGMQAAFAANASGIWPIAGVDETALRPDPALMDTLAAALRIQPCRPRAAWSVAGWGSSAATNGLQLPAYLAILATGQHRERTMVKIPPTRARAKEPPFS